jgi:hypothetical protein
VFLFSATLLIGSIVLKPYLGTTTQKRDFIIIFCSINLGFCVYYLWEVKNLERIFKLENKNVVKFGKRIGGITLIYIPHIFTFSLLLFRDLHNLEKIMVILILFLEVLLTILSLKEVYDLVFLEERRRNFEIEENRKKYVEKEKKPLPGEEFNI